VRRTRATADIVKRKLRDTRVELEEKRQGLSDTTTGTEDSDLGGLEIAQDSQYIVWNGISEVLRKQKRANNDILG
jgi:hypothetical protein